MEDNAKMIELLLQKAVDYGKTSYELGKLKVIDKTLDVVSSVIPHAFVFFLFASAILFINLGLALWLGEILGKIYFGFFVIAGFYVIVMIAIHFFMHNWLKKHIYNYIIKQVFK